MFAQDFPAGQRWEFSFVSPGSYKPTDETEDPEKCADDAGGALRVGMRVESAGRIDEAASENDDRRAEHFHRKMSSRQKPRLVRDSNSLTAGVDALHIGFNRSCHPS